MPTPDPRPLKRRQEAWRIVVAALGGLLLWTLQFTEAMPLTTLQPLLDLVLGTGAIVLVHWRRRWPVAVALVLALATAASALAVMAALLAFVSLVTTRRWRGVVLVAVAFIGAAYAYEALVPTSEVGLSTWWLTLAVTGAILGIACFLGLYVRARRDLADSRRERAETAEREQVARLDQARMSERTRIAREMHDVLAHRISLVSLHAGAMAFRDDLTADELRASARVVQENARTALGELRDVLGVLRDPDLAGSPPPQPQPQLTDLPALLEEARAAGTPVRLEGAVPPVEHGASTVGRTAYRIVQESLTNARKHAPGAPVRLRLDVVDDRLEIVVSNPLLAAVGSDGNGDEPTGAGLGLVGLAERAELAGGALDYRRTGDHYELRGWLPWAP